MNVVNKRPGDPSERKQCSASAWGTSRTGSSGGLISAVKREQGLQTRREGGRVSGHAHRVRVWSGSGACLGNYITTAWACGVDGWSVVLS